ncbi:hypothetical protein SBA3_170002 [Candidatus Sulfopaludibacter sp. SbA3]|nr:hypothetical protein SBA3_170002 [Candidatus Sulfopaludibacter sp. SbA3]
MPLHRRKVYLERKRIGAWWLNYFIYLSAAIVILSLVGCLPDVANLVARWFLPAAVAERIGVVARPEYLLTEFFEFLLAVSGIFLVLALCIRFQAGPRAQPHRH